MARGFTLLEALVTLVIVALIATVLMQSLFHVLGLRERVLRSENEARIGALHERWFRESVAAAVADLPGSEGAFRGDANGFRVLSVDPVAGGRAEVIEWVLIDGDVGMRLDLVQRRDRWTVLGPGLEAASFRYLDNAGHWHSEWPALPSSDHVGAHAVPDEVLPRAIAFAGERRTGPLTWWVAIGASPQPPLPARVWEAFGDAGL